MADEPSAEAQRFGSLIPFLIRECFSKIETLNPDANHRYYLECKLCGGTDELRPIIGSKPGIDLVKHGGACTLAEHLPRLRELAATNGNGERGAVYRRGYERAREDAAQLVERCNHEGPFQAIGAASRIRALVPLQEGS